MNIMCVISPTFLVLAAMQLSFAKSFDSSPKLFAFRDVNID